MDASRALIDLSRLQDAIRQLAAASIRETEAFVGVFDSTNPDAQHALLEAHMQEVEAMKTLLAILAVFERRLPALQRAILDREMPDVVRGDHSG